MKEKKGHIVLSPFASATDGTSLASKVGVKFEKAVRIRIAISDAEAPDPDCWNFRPVSVSVVSAWAGDVQLHLGSIFAAVMKAGGKTARTEWNGFEINPRMIMKLIVALRLYDSIKGKNVNVENLIGLQHTFRCSYSELVDIDDIPKVRRYAEIVDTRSVAALQFFKDYHRIWRRGKNFEKVKVLLEKTHKLSYEEAVYMIEREFKVCRLVARHLLKEDNHWTYYQYEAGKTVKVGDRVYQHISYQPKF